jgi:uncharacterized damage-inducible protein DinB
MGMSFIEPEAVLTHWQGHRRLTRRLIDAYPEEQLFTFSLGGMRPFGLLAQEMLAMTVPMVKGIVTGEWRYDEDKTPHSKADLLRLWDEATNQLDAYWTQIRPDQFAQHIVAFGQYPGATSDLLLYVIDNEIHHRGQGYVYLRALGIEPPPFYDRS